MLVYPSYFSRLTISNLQLPVERAELAVEPDGTVPGPKI